ncbi:MAG: 2-dehydro-3-deoxygalactonokinase [Proteobacteria bacterium]|nr:2-dehydro-3-deoxygalactonokinase [Pseudomonadota bacterium]MBS0574474.1 2-dehydro-3-deoxygalactonokinase [Pseudomonadota bacterium]
MSGLSGLDWIAADWGTTNLRVWALDAAGRVLARATGGRGMGKLTRADYEPALLDMVGGWLGADRVPVLICGMAGSRQGWAEAPYAAVPCAPLAAGRTVRPAVADGRLDVHLLPGLQQDSPADVMRGEETQIAGLLAGRPGFDGVLCLPGTHSKWVRISAGEVVSFQTAMTGELFALLSGQSVLRHGMAGEGWDEAAFAEGLGQAISRPERLAARLFAIRAEGLLHGLPPEAARSRLSGLLIGAELAGARPYWLGQEVAIVGAEGIGGAYRRALAGQGVEAVLADGEAMVLAGLGAARALMRGH